MADEYTQTGVCSGNWWEPSRNRFETGSSPSPSSSSMTHLNTMATFGPHDDSAAAAVLADPNLQLMGLGLSSQSMDWNNNQALLRGGTMLQEEINRPGGLSFSLDHASHHQFDSHSSSGDSTVMDSPYANNNNNHSHNPGNMLQGLLGSDQHQAATARYYHPYAENYGINTSSDQVLSNSWISQLNNKFPQQFLRTTSPPNSHQFSNNAPYWLATASGPATARPGFFQPSSPQMHVPTAASFDEKPKIATEKVQESSTAGGKKSGSEPGIKRSRNEPPASLPAFKVRKEKMGDRITALQQLVSPFGKTDTASVLTEAIEYIKFLHQQVNVLSTPYMNSTGAHLIQHQQASSDKSRDPEGPNLRSRGLCLVPISSTFPVTHETTVDFWTPTFGGTFR